MEYIEAKLIQQRIHRLIKLTHLLHLLIQMDLKSFHIFFRIKQFPPGFIDDAKSNFAK